MPQRRQDIIRTITIINYYTRVFGKRNDVLWCEPYKRIITTFGTTRAAAITISERGYEYIKCRVLWSLFPNVFRKQASC